MPQALVRELMLLEHMGCEVLIHDEPTGQLHAIGVRYPRGQRSPAYHSAFGLRLMYVDDRGVMQAQGLREEVTDAHASA